MYEKNLEVQRYQNKISHLKDIKGRLLYIYITWNKRKKWSLIDQKDFKTKLYNIDIFSTRRTTILQIFIIIDSNERKLYKSCLKYNGTLFRVDVKLYKYPNETSWKLINVKANNIKANVSYVEEDSYKLLHEKSLHRARTIYFYYVGRIHLEMALIVISVRVTIYPSTITQSY